MSKRKATSYPEISETEISDMEISDMEISETEISNQEILDLEILYHQTISLSQSTNKKPGVKEKVQEREESELKKKKAKFKELIKACREDNIDKIKEMFQSEIDLDIRDTSSGNSLITFLVINKKYEILKLFIDKGAKLNIVNSLGCSTLDYMDLENKEIVKLLVENGARFNDTEIRDCTLFKYVEDTDHEMVKFLLEKKAVQPNVMVGRNNDIPVLTYSISKKFYEITKALLNHGAYIHPIVKGNLGPLDYAFHKEATGKEDKEIIEFLIEKGAKFSDQSKANRVLEYYVDNKYEGKLVELAIKAGANPNLKIDGGGNNILDLLVQSETHTFEEMREIIKIFLQNGGRFSKEYSADQVLETYFSNKDYEMVELLFSSHSAGGVTFSTKEGRKIEEEHMIVADVNLRIDLDDEENNTLLHIAIKNKDIKMYKLLMTYGADCNLKNALGLTPFQLAQKLEEDNKNIEVSNCLLQQVNSEWVHSGETEVPNLGDQECKNIEIML